MPISAGSIFVQDATTKRKRRPARLWKWILAFFSRITISGQRFNSKDTSMKRFRNFERHSSQTTIHTRSVSSVRPMHAVDKKRTREKFLPGSMNKETRDALRLTRWPLFI